VESFGESIRNRRRQLEMTQEELARRIGTSSPYVGHLEARKRHPSQEVVMRIAEVLGLDARELFLLANPGTRVLVSPKPSSAQPSAWDAFVSDRNLRKVLNITDQEMEILSSIATMGEVRSPHDFIFILNTIRNALGR